MALEPRVDRLEAALSHLAEAQARTEESMRQLAAAQARAEERFAWLEEAQARTDLAVQALAQQVGRLADTIGFTLEDLAREVTPGLSGAAL
jgi:CRISPR/Cas system CSM-associated protein Csm2 small subunit